jgi:hypothetical protein
MGFETHMIGGSRAHSCIHARLAHPAITNQDKLGLCHGPGSDITQPPRMPSLSLSPTGMRSKLLIDVRTHTSAIVDTVIAAFIGATLGSIGAVVVAELYRARHEQRASREALIRGYVFQLQDAVEALWHRVYNVGYEGGKGAMTPKYLQTTTAYALGRVLAAERVLALEGVYPQLNRLFPELGKSLQDRRLSVALNFPNLQQYDRIALAEAVLERNENGFWCITYLAFQAQYGQGKPESMDWLMAAQGVVDSLSTDPHKTKVDDLLELLGMIAHHTSNATGIPTSIVEKEEAWENRRDEREKA